MAKLFSIPTIQEVVDHIQFKMPHWPGSFTAWYGEKFWNHYQSSGWRLSSNILMKDWKACFSSQWKDLRFPADREKLEECKITELAKSYNYPEQKIGPSPVEVFYEKFKNGEIDRKGMAGIYKWLWNNDFLKFTQSEVNKLVMDSGNDKEYGRYLAVKLYFLKRIENERCEYKTGSLNV
jgi:hypothetical protein